MLADQPQLRRREGRRDRAKKKGLTPCNERQRQSWLYMEASVFARDAGAVGMKMTMGNQGGGRKSSLRRNLRRAPPARVTRDLDEDRAEGAEDSASRGDKPDKVPFIAGCGF